MQWFEVVKELKEWARDLSEANAEITPAALLEKIDELETEWE